MDIAIVVAAYNRPESLKRLLSSISKSSIHDDVTLYISIDGDGDIETRQLAQQFEWNNGEKKLVLRDTNLGLRDHILACSDLVVNHDGIIVLEDDLYVAPFFYEYAKQTLEFYSQGDKIAGISLYTHCFNETAEMAFIPLPDGNDVFFMQLASSWGQCYSRSQWETFRAWHLSKDSKLADKVDIPPDVEKWPASSWKKDFIRYMVSKGLYFIYPRTSHCTNFGDKGVNQNDDNHFQVPLILGKKDYKFCKLEDSLAVYDSYCEILPGCLNRLAIGLNSYNYTVDLYGTKILERIDNQYLLSSRTTNAPILSFGRKMIPHEINVIEEINGNDIHLAAKNSFHSGSLGFTSARMVYFHRLPGWHQRSRKYKINQVVSLTENEERLLRLYERMKWFFFPVLWLSKTWSLIKRNILS